MNEPDYFTRDDAPGRYFCCKRYGIMRDSSCAQNYREAPRLSRVSGRLAGCVGCPTGALHCGGKPEDAARFGCTRCRETKGLRMVRGGLLCVSCFNREREVVAGANAKGRPPTLRLFPVNVLHVNGAVAAVTRHPLAIDRVEAALAVMHRGGSTVAVAWLSAELVRVPEGELCGT